MAAENTRSNRKSKDGFVLSNKMDKTLVVGIPRKVQHALYGKIMTKYTKVYVDDQDNIGQVGDMVTIMETRPLSKLKRWRLVKVLKHED